MPYSIEGKPNAPFGRRELEVDLLTDFSGGLNYRADAFQLAENESPELLNVDVNPDGGFQMRKAVNVVNSTALSNAPHSIFSFANSGGTHQFLVGNGTKTHYSTGGNFTDTGTTWTTSDRQESAVMKDFGYIQNGTDAPRKWTGAAISNLTQTFNEDLLNPNQGDMPIAYHIAVHRDFMFLANTFESGVRHRNRVRFSHPNEPEDWRSADFFDIEQGRSGDQIMAIVPYKDRLLVFKQHSTHVVTGLTAEGLSQAALSYEFGIAGPNAVCTDGEAVYFFSWPEGVFRYDGNSVTWLFNNLYPKILDGSIPDGAQSKIALGWCHRRLWVSVPYEGSSVNAETFVWDPMPSPKKQRGKYSGPGSWVRYNFGVLAFLEWHPIGSQHLDLAVQPQDPKKILKLEQDADNDDYGNGATQIETYFETRWVVGDNPARKKRFKRADFVLDNVIAVGLQARVKRDYDTSRIIKEFDLDNDPPASNLTVWGDDWDTELVWSGDSTNSQKIVRAASLGSARSVQLTIVGPQTSKRFGVNLVGVKWFPKTLR